MFYKFTLGLHIGYALGASTGWEPKLSTDESSCVWGKPNRKR
jgi:hypothetical protein